LSLLDNLLAADYYLEVFKVYDYESQKYVEPTLAIFLKARDSAAAWPGTIEAGPDVALEILRNRVRDTVVSIFYTYIQSLQVKLTRCLSCYKGGNGASARKRGDALKGEPGPLFLSCQCPIDTSLTELWMVKVTGDNPHVPKFDDEDLATAPADFSFNPVNLRIVQGAITASSGLTTQTMFQTKTNRLITTIQWALNELGTGYTDHVDKDAIGRFADGFAGIVARLREDDDMIG
jgi:hypothetical protein